MKKITFKRSWNEYINEWETVAVIPDAIVNAGNVLSYMFIGQHGEASIEWINKLPDCPPVDSVDLANELVSLGYVL